MKREEILCLVILLLGVVLVMPLIMADSIAGIKANSNYSSTLNISFNNTVVPAATNLTCYYNASGGAVSSNLTIIYNTTANHTIFENATFSINTSLPDSTSYNISCSVVNMTYANNFSAVISGFTIDHTPPNVTITWPSAGWNRSGVIQINVTINDTMHLFTNLSVNISTAGGTQQTLLNMTNQTAGGRLYNVTFSTSSLTDGTYNISVVARDQAGNVNNSVFIGYLKFDNAAPSVSIAKSNSTLTSLGLTITASDTTSGVNETCTISRSTGTVSGTSGTQTIAESSLTCSTTYAYIATCIDQTGNSATSASSSFQTSSCGANSLPGGGGGSTTPTWSNTYVVTDEQFSGGYTQQMSTNHRAEIKVGTSKHYVGVKSVTASDVTIEISSDPIQIKLGIGEDAKTDVDKDGTYDVYVKLNAITNNKADLTIQKISEAVAKEGDVVTTSGEVTTPGAETPKAEEKKGMSSKVWIIIGIIALVVIIGAGVAVKKK